MYKINTNYHSNSLKIHNLVHKLIMKMLTDVTNHEKMNIKIE